MKITICVLLTAFGFAAQAQTIVGRWQLTEEKTCFQAEMKESDTEKELTAAMQASSKTSVARIVTFDEKGGAEEAIASAGKKKQTSKNSFKYQITDTELQFLDKKSGLVTARFVIDEFTTDKLVIHDAARECEIKTYIRAK